MKEITNEDQLTLLKIKSLLNHLAYVIRDDDKLIVDEYHTLCRKYCSWGEQEEKK